MPNSDKPVVKDRILLAGVNRIPVGSPPWYEWLSTARTFSFKGPGGNFVARSEKRRNKDYWYAYRRAGKLIKVYLGKSEELTPERLEQASLSLSDQTLFSHLAHQSGAHQSTTVESRIDTSLLPLTKITAPVLPRQLVSRPRLTRQINTPLTVIYAPSGFGKSTLLNDWKQICGHPVAWLSLDEGDNDIVRFWYLVTLALQTVNEELGKEVLSYLSTASPLQLPEVVSRLTNDIVRCQPACPHLGLVLDDLHLIQRTEI
jgi:LuxR family maltose regulon positive regulatory protein